MAVNSGRLIKEAPASSATVRVAVVRGEPSLSPARTAAAQKTRRVRVPEPRGTDRGASEVELA